MTAKEENDSLLKKSNGGGSNIYVAKAYGLWHGSIWHGVSNMKIAISIYLFCVYMLLYNGEGRVMTIA